MSENERGQKRKAATDGGENGVSNEGSIAAVSSPDWRKSKRQFVKQMQHSFKTGLYTDVSFKVGPGKSTINAHKAILMIRSKVFADILSSKWTPADPDNHMRIINIPDRNPEIFVNFLKYLYTDAFPMDISIKQAMEILDLACLYQVSGLIDACSKFLKSRMGGHNCIEIYQRTQSYTDLDLSAKALNFIHRNIEWAARDDNDQFLLLDVAMLTNLLKKDDIHIAEVDLFKALLRWGNAEGKVKDQDGEMKERKEVMQSLIPSIRFLLISPRMFARVVVPAKVLSDEQVIEVMCTRLNGDTNKNAQMKAWSKPRARPYNQYY